MFCLQIEQLQTELNKLRYEHSFLQQEYKHERTTHQQVIDEMKLRHEAEVSHLERVVTELLKIGGNDFGVRKRTQCNQMLIPTTPVTGTMNNS